LSVNLFYFPNSINSCRTLFSEKRIPNAISLRSRVGITNHLVPCFFCGGIRRGCCSARIITCIYCMYALLYTGENNTACPRPTVINQTPRAQYARIRGGADYNIIIIIYRTARFFAFSRSNVDNSRNGRKRQLVRYFGFFFSPRINRLNIYTSYTNIYIKLF